MSPKAPVYPVYRPTPEEAARRHVAGWDRPPASPRIAPPCRALVYDVLAHADHCAGARGDHGPAARLRARALALLDDPAATEANFRAWLRALRAHVAATGRDRRLAPGTPARLLWARVVALTGGGGTAPVAAGAAAEGAR